MQMTYRFYVIFHKEIYETCYKDLDPTYLSSLTFMGVNAKIPKQIPDSLAKAVVFERDLPMYNPLWQYAKMCENSVLLHVFKHPEYMNYDYIGFFQYDMILNNRVFSTIDSILQTGNTSTVFYFHKENSCRHLDQVIGLQGWQNIVDVYNSMFQTNHSLLSVLVEDIVLFHTFLLPKQIFVKLMTFFERAFPRMFELLGCEVQHLVFHLERMHGLFLLLQQMEGHVSFVQMPDIVHSDSLKDSERANYFTGAGLVS